MTINGPAATILAFFLNTAIDQQCERYIRENGLEEVVTAKLAEKYGDTPPVYHGELPEGNDGLGLMLLGLTALVLWRGARIDGLKWGVFRAGAGVAA